MNRQKTVSIPEWQDAGEGVKSLVRMLQGLFFLLRILIVLILVWVVFSGMFYVREHQEAMLFRFGKLQPKGGQEILTSGHWYWAWPYPIDRVEKIPAQRSVTITSTQFWPQTNPNQIQAPEGTPSPEGEGQALRPGEGGYLLTGDANIMHMVWTITFRINDAKKYYLHFYSDSGLAPGTGKTKDARRSAEDTIKSLLDEAVLNEVATWPVESVMVLSRVEAQSQERETLGSAVRQRVEKLVAKIDLGIEIQQVSLFEVQPPLATKDAFRQVVDAAQDYRTEIDKAKAYEKDVVTQAEGMTARITAEAKAYKTRIVESVKASAAYFEKVLDEYEKNPRTMLVALYTDAIREVLNQVETKYVVHSKENGKQEIRLLLGPEPEKPNKSQK